MHNLLKNMDYTTKNLTKDYEKTRLLEGNVYWFVRKGKKFKFS